jgi:DNA-binding beta-propeller fold protein YncE
MQLALYEPLGIVCGLGAAFYLFTRRRPDPVADTPEAPAAPAAAPEPPAAPATPAAEETGSRKGRRRKRRANTGDSLPLPDEAYNEAPPQAPAAPAAAQPAAPPDDPLTRVPSGNLFPLLLVVWYFSSVVIFSWAGEKMPWLTVHMSLPGNLLAAWVLWRLLKLLPPLRRPAAPEQPATDGEPATQPAPTWRMFLVPPALIVLLVALSVALWRLRGDAAGQEGQMHLLQGLIPLLIVGLLLYALLTLAQQVGGRVLLAMAGLTMAALLGAYMIRASWLAVYTHPDVPIELLVYTQTSPDVPRYIEEIRELAINQTRNHRSPEDVTGGLTMPIVLSSGAESLAWPVQWYLRDFQRLSWMDGETLRNATRQTFEVELPNGQTGLAPAVMIASPHVSAETRQVLEQHYVQPYGETGVFNWWFPEGDKCSPQNPGYKRFYFNSVTSYSQISEPPPEGCVAESLPPAEADQRINELFAQVEPPWMPIVWPFLPQNWQPMRDYLLFRDLPYPLQPGSRDMQVWLRADLVSGTGTGAAASGDATGPLRLLAERAFGEVGTLAAPTGIAVDSEGRVYVADTLNHRIQVYDRWGELERSMGSQGSGEGQFNEPRGIAIDSDDNVYVADTWNARVVKIAPDGDWLATWGSGNTDMGGGRMATINETPEDNRANPLGFFGPRGIAVDSAGNVYVADTGNKRIVMTDDTGEFIYQWGESGSEPGSFNEPTSLAIDEADNLIYVADTWNGRVQAFERDAQGQAAPFPVATWPVDGWMSNTYDDPALAVGPEGRVYVSAPAREQVAALSSSSGRPVLRWGGEGESLSALNSPSGIAFDAEGRVYVVDRALGRVLRFDVPPVEDETQDTNASTPEVPR